VFAFAILTRWCGTGVANCGHDVHHGAVQFQQTKLDDNNAIQHYFSPNYIVMNDPKDPRHRSVGECRGQGKVTPEGASWIPGCTQKPGLIGKTGKWFGVESGGGSYFCDD
jgi:hypothetical protein